MAIQLDLQPLRRRTRNISPQFITEQDDETGIDSNTVSVKVQDTDKEKETSLTHTVLSDKSETHTVSVKVQDTDKEKETSLTHTVCDGLTFPLTHTVSVKGKVKRPHTVSVKAQDTDKEKETSLTHTVLSDKSETHTVSVKAQDTDKEKETSLTHTVYEKTNLIPYELREIKPKVQRQKGQITRQDGELISALIKYKNSEDEKGILIGKIKQKQLAIMLNTSEAAIKQRLAKAVKMGYIIRTEFDKNGTGYLLTHTPCDHNARARSSSNLSNLLMFENSTTNRQNFSVNVEEKQIASVWRCVLNSAWSQDGIDVDFILGLINKGKIKPYAYKKIVLTLEKLFFAKKYGIQISGKPVQSIRALFLWSIENNDGYIEIPLWDRFSQLKTALSDCSIEQIERVFFGEIQRKSKFKGGFER